MGVSFENGVLRLEEEIRLKIPLPIIDIPIPIAPTIPSIDFPPFPDVPTDLINLKERFDFLNGLQAQMPDVSLETGGSLSFDPNGGVGVPSPVTTEIPSASIDYDALFALIDIPIPVPPTIPSIDFPPFPDVPTDLIDLKARFDFLTDLQAQMPDVSLETGGSLSFDPNGGVGVPSPVTTEIPSASIDYDALFALIDIPIPVPPTIPSIDFPPFPDPISLFGDLGIDPDLYLATQNLPDLPGYDPQAPQVAVSLYINDLLIS
jgi:hypothetical protein